MQQISAYVIENYTIIQKKMMQ